MKPTIFTIQTFGLLSIKLGSIHSGSSGFVLNRFEISLALNCTVNLPTSKKSQISEALQCIGYDLSNKKLTAPTALLPQPPRLYHFPFQDGVIFLETVDFMNRLDGCVRLTMLLFDKHYNTNAPVWILCSSFFRLKINEGSSNFRL